MALCIAVILWVCTCESFENFIGKKPIKEIRQIDNFEILKSNSRSTNMLGSHYIPDYIPLILPEIYIFTTQVGNYWNSETPQKFYIPIDSYSNIKCMLKTFTTLNKDQFPLKYRFNEGSTIKELYRKYKDNDWNITKYNNVLDTYQKKYMFQTYFTDLPVSLGFNPKTQTPVTSNMVTNITSPDYSKSIWVSVNDFAQVQREPIVINNKLKPSLKDLVDSPEIFYDIEDLVQDTLGNNYCRIKEQNWDILKESIISYKKITKGEY